MSAFVSAQVSSKRQSTQIVITHNRVITKTRIGREAKIMIQVITKHDILIDNTEWITYLGRDRHEHFS